MEEAVDVEEEVVVEVRLQSLSFFWGGGSSHAMQTKVGIYANDDKLHDKKELGYYFIPPLSVPTEDGHSCGILDCISSISTTSGRCLTAIFYNQSM